MAKDFYPEISVALRLAGWWRVDGGKGSHEKWKNGDGKSLIVPRTNSRHTANAIMKQAELKKAF